MPLAMRTQHPVEACLAGKVGAFIGEHRHDPSRWRIGKTRLVGYRDDPGLFGLAQCVRRDRTIGIWPPITDRQAITSLPALQRTGIESSQSTGWGKPCTVGAGSRDIAHQDLAVFQAGHTSSPSLKTAASLWMARPSASDAGCVWKRRRGWMAKTPISVLGIDLGKNSCSVAGLD